MDLSIWFAFGAMFGWGLTDFLIQRTIKKVGWLETLWWIYLGSFVILLPFVVRPLFSISSPDFIWLVVLGAVGLLSAITHFQALRVGKLSVVETILAFELPLTILLGVLFLHNRLSNIQIALIALVFIGIILISLDFRNLRPQHWLTAWFLKKQPLLEKGAVLAIVTAIFLALTNFLIAVQAVRVDALLLLWLSWASGGFICLGYLILKRRLRTIAANSRQNWALILAMVIIDIASWLSFTYALAAGGELAVTTAITQSYVVVAMLLGLWFNKEKIRAWQYGGAALAIAGSLLIGLLDK